jgi:hypothetical protein
MGMPNTYQLLLGKFVSMREKTKVNRARTESFELLLQHVLVLRANSPDAKLASVFQPFFCMVVSSVDAHKRRIFLTCAEDPLRRYSGISIKMDP